MSEYDEVLRLRPDPDYIPMLPWHEDVKKLARLYTWLTKIREQEVDVVHFLLNAQEDYSQDWADLCMWSGKS